MYLKNCLKGAKAKMDCSRSSLGYLVKIEGFSLIVVSWVLRARWREIQRFVIQSQLIPPEFIHLVLSL